MTLEIGLVLAILAGALALFVSEKVRMDVTALIVMGALVVTGLVTPEDAVAGFANGAVIAVWAMFILSDGLTRTGIANVIGRIVLRYSGTSQWTMTVVIMLTAGILSAFMNNIGVAALMLPVVIEIARRTKIPASKLLMPLAYGCLLGGLTTMVGTPPNLLISGALQQAGETPFGLFHFTPIGAGVLLAGTLFIALAGRHLLPSIKPEEGNAAPQSAQPANPVCAAFQGIRNARAARFHPGRQDARTKPHRRGCRPDRDRSRAGQPYRTHAVAPGRPAGRGQAGGAGAAGPLSRVSALE